MSKLEKLEEFDVVALTEDVPAEGLLRGQVGTVVEVYDGDHVEVEFVDGRGATYALLPLGRSQMMRLHFSPIAAA